MEPLGLHLKLRLKNTDKRNELFILTKQFELATNFRPIEFSQGATDQNDDIELGSKKVIIRVKILLRTTKIVILLVLIFQIIRVLIDKTSQFYK